VVSKAFNHIRRAVATATDYPEASELVVRQNAPELPAVVRLPSGSFAVHCPETEGSLGVIPRREVF
jgi:hypothetical protein